MVGLDNTIVSVGLPPIGRDLHAGLHDPVGEGDRGPAGQDR
jgi:hypothetical protein